MRGGGRAVAGAPLLPLGAAPRAWLVLPGRQWCLVAVQATRRRARGAAAAGAAGCGGRRWLRGGRGVVLQ